VEWLAPEASDAERRVLMHFLRVAGDGAAVAGFLGLSDLDTTDEARRLRVPTLVVAGDEDRNVGLARSRRLAATIPGARFEILQGASHLDASINDPRLQRMVSEFLAQQGAD
jgi:pimeloyl-ACP methyl ester carboxylesterase